MKTSKTRKEECREELLKILKPGDTVHCVLRSVAKSGMSRRIDFYKWDADGRLFLTSLIADLLELRYDTKAWASHSGARVDGCGMDMGFHVVNSLGYALYPNGFECVGKPTDSLAPYIRCSRACPSNEHSNGDDNYGPHHHASGGYAFRSEWI